MLYHSAVPGISRCLAGGREQSKPCWTSRAQAMGPGRRGWVEGEECYVGSPAWLCIRRGQCIPACWSASWLVSLPTTAGLTPPNEKWRCAPCLCLEEAGPNRQHLTPWKSSQQVTGELPMSLVLCHHYILPEHPSGPCWALCKAPWPFQEDWALGGMPSEACRQECRNGDTPSCSLDTGSLTPGHWARADD